MPRTLIILLALLTVSPVLSAQAETRYVSDQLKITLRDGKGLQHTILESLVSGTPVEILKVDRKNGYTYVRAPSGREGWVHTRFLMDEPAARNRIADMRKRMQRNQARMEKMEGQQEKLQALRKENGQLKAELKRIRELSKNAVALKERAESLEQRNQEQAEELQRLRKENNQLQDLSAQSWFTRGAGVIIAGMLVGLILPRIRFRKKRRYEF
ncbi:TIGR04211 family SH3 domain-containing protein [Thiohalorhabdus methylotrophus]|uniref:TIGR04211 family SH3 domain-containing protein n=1 Tax=Thiohalorhabdus methylotrophus TaxID=3242694 RepID=A0ABV4TXK7_9GAMM